MAKGLYEFEAYFGRMGSLNGTFVEDSATVNKIIGREVYFGEVLGKHSDISCEIDEDNIKLLTDDQDFIDKAIKYKLVPNGYNPIAYYLESAYGENVCEECKFPSKDTIEVNKYEFSEELWGLLGDDFLKKLCFDCHEILEAKLKHQLALAKGQNI